MSGGDAMPQEGAERKLSSAEERREFERQEWHGWMCDMEEHLKAAIIVLAEFVVDEPGNSERVDAMKGLIRSRGLVGCVALCLTPEHDAFEKAADAHFAAQALSAGNEEPA